MEYRKAIKLDANSEYWFVEMGELNRLNGWSRWPFPSLEAAQTFAESQKALALAVYGIHREVQIKHPDGSVQEL